MAAAWSQIQRLKRERLDPSHAADRILSASSRRQHLDRLDARRTSRPHESSLGTSASNRRRPSHTKSSSRHSSFRDSSPDLDRQRYHACSTVRIERRGRRSSPTYSPYRGDSRHETLISPSRSRSPNRRPRSRSRSRDRRGYRSRRSLSRSRSVDSCQRDYNPRSFWTHDKFTDTGPSSPVRKIVPDDYRPPSPEWVSRAGGVAIMKKKRPKIE